MVVVMVIDLGLYRSPPRYLFGSPGPVRRSRRRASTVGVEEPSLARPHLPASRNYGMVLYRHLWRWGYGGFERERGLFSLCGGVFFPLYVFKCIRHVSTFGYVSRCIRHVSICIPCIVYSGYVFRCIQHVFVTDAQDTCADTSVIHTWNTSCTIHTRYIRDT